MDLMHGSAGGAVQDGGRGGELECVGWGKGGGGAVGNGWMGVRGLTRDEREWGGVARWR